MLALVKSFDFFIPTIPKPRNSIRVKAITDAANNPIRTKNGKIKILKYHSKSSNNELAYLKWSFVSMLPKGWIPHTGPVAIKKLHYIFPFTKQARKQQNGSEVVIKSTKPDLQDNLNKLLFDAMKGIVIADDALIFEINDTMKIYGDNPGIHLVLYLYEHKK